MPPRGVWRSLVARLLWEQDVGSSNLSTPTRFCGSRGRVGCSVRLARARSSNWIEHQPSKLGVVGSIPAGRASVSVEFPNGEQLLNERKFPMIEVHTWPTPNGHKIHIMVEETGLEYEVRPVNIRTGEQFKPEFLRISPNNKIPAIVDRNGPDGRPIAVFESGAILIYLAAKTGKLLPRDDRGKYVALQWLMFQMGSVGPMMGQVGHFRSNAVPERIEYAINRYTNEVKRLHGVMEKRLSEAAYFGGSEYSIADIAIFPWLRASERNGIDWAEFPRVKKWFDGIGARPAVQRALKVLADAQTTQPGQYDPKARESLFGATLYQRH